MIRNMRKGKQLSPRAESKETMSSLQNSGSFSPGAALPTMGQSTMSGSLWGYHLWGVGGCYCIQRVEVRGTAPHPATHREALHKELSGHKWHSGAEVKKHCSHARVIMHV